MNLNDLSIATITWARTEEEENYLKNALLQLSFLKVPVFITDGGSGENFLKFIQSIPHFYLSAPTKGVWPQTRSSLNAAYERNAPFILYTEPDKADFFQKYLPSILSHLTTNETTGVILASRSVHGFRTFPAFQQITETTINQCCKEVMGLNIDYVYGPFLMNRNLIPFLQQLPDTTGWGWRPFTFNLAKRKGLKLESVEGNYECPADQREDAASERIYRMKQMNQNIEGLVLSTQVDLN